MPRMGDLAATDVYSAFDVPLEQSTNVRWANRLGEILTTRPQYDESTIYQTASPLVNISEGDIGRATEAALAGTTVTPKGIKAYHSSPHDFERFDLSKIGTGEGAQVYGHGLYFAESPAVSGQGGQYWQQFAGRFGSEEQRAAERLRDLGFNRAKAIEEAHADIASAKHGLSMEDKGSVADFWRAKLAQTEAELKHLQSDKPVGPRTYEVNIKADPAHMLDWDKAFKEQSPHVQNVLRDDLYLAPIEKETGRELYRQAYPLVDDLDVGRVRATERLREAGIPGIKYLDEGSRGPQVVANLGGRYVEPPKQTYNYVVFDPSLIDIMKKYGIAGAAPVGMGALAAQDRYE